MGLLGWVMMALAIWHFTIFLPDRFWGGIVGAFIGAIIGGVIFGLILYLIKSGTLGFPGRKPTDILVILYSVPGAILGIAATYWLGVRRENLLQQAH
jgi:hypothetical protein